MRNGCSSRIAQTTECTCHDARWVKEAEIVLGPTRCFSLRHGQLGMGHHCPSPSVNPLTSGRVRWLGLPHGLPIVGCSLLFLVFLQD